MLNFITLMCPSIGLIESRLKQFRIITMYMSFGVNIDISFAVVLEKIVYHTHPIFIVS